MWDIYQTSAKHFQRLHFKHRTWQNVETTASQLVKMVQQGEHFHISQVNEQAPYLMLCIGQVQDTPLDHWLLLEEIAPCTIGKSENLPH